MPLSIFLGRVLQAGEPLWLEDDQEWAIALLANEADACRGCGQPRSESQAVVTNDQGRTVPAHTYEVDRIECASCRAMSVSARDAADHPHPSSLQYLTRRQT